MQQDDLFSKAAEYPHAPAYRNTDTSKAAADAIKPSAKTIRNAVLHSIKVRGDHGATSKELAWILGLRYEAVQPRTSELRAQELIKDSGQRRASRAEDKLAIVWVAI